MAIKWTDEQEKAITKTGSNIIVSAGAGSGKTAVLTERVIQKLLGNKEKNIEPVNINELLIMTFTDAASQEMKERIRKAIIKSGALNEQLDLLTTSYICTFDSFCLSIVRKYHYLLNVDSNISVMDNNINTLKIQEIIEEIFNELYEEENPEFLELIRAWCVKDDKNLKTGFLSIYNKINLLVEKEEFLNNYINSYFTEENMEKIYSIYEEMIRQKVKEYIDFCDQFTKYYDENGKDKYNVRRAQLLGIVKGECPVSEIDSKFTMPTLIEVSDKIKKERGKHSNQKTEISNLAKHTKDYLFNQIYATKPLQEMIIKIVKEIDKRISLFKKQTNTYTFMDIEKLAIKVIRENKNVQEELRNSFKEIMIDEYQDTSDIQEYFVNLIANNNVFMVGDIKQSIYRFRHANPYLFQSKYDRYGKNDGGIKIDLTSNYRSRKEVVDDINTTFSKIMTPDVGGADYIASHNMKHGNNDYNEIAKDVKHNYDLIKYYSDDQKRITDDEIEAYIIGYDIKDKIDNHYQVMDKIEQEINGEKEEIVISRDVEYKDFTILLRKTDNFELYKKVFNNLNIPLNVYTSEKIIEDYDIKVLHNILKLIISNNFYNLGIEEKYALTSILRSYLISETDENIYNIYYNKTFKETTVYKQIEELRKYKDVISIKEMLEKIEDTFGIVEKANKSQDVKKILVHMEYLSKLSQSLSDLGYTLEEYVKYINDVFENKLKIEYDNKLLSVDNAAKIMTIHKSKGLQFGICYFPRLSKEFNFKDCSNDFVFDNELGIIVPEVEFGKRDTMVKEIYKHKEKMEIISEENRIWYVALTRTKEKIIFVSKEIEDNIVTKVKSYDDFMFDYFEQSKLSNKPIYYPDTKIEEFINLSNKSSGIDELKKSIDENNTLDVNEICMEKEQLAKNSFSKRINDLITKETKEKLELGTLIHEALERIDFKTKDFSVLDIDSKYYSFITEFLNCDLLKNVDKGKVYKEYQFYDQVNNVNGSIDLMIEYDNYIDIIDYKLKHTDDEAYLKQLNGYKNYIYNKTKKEVNIYLYSIVDKVYRKL